MYICFEKHSYGKFGPRVYNVSRISLLGKKKKIAPKMRVTAPILKPPDDNFLGA